MKAYESKSIEELRYEDYISQRKNKKPNKDIRKWPSNLNLHKNQQENFGLKGTSSEYEDFCY